MAKKQKNTPKQKTAPAPKRKVANVPSSPKSSSNRANQGLVFDKSNLLYMLIGLGVIFLGFILMSGGAMEDPNVWDEDVIYSFRRITLAPILVLVGLGINIYAIFKK